MIREIRNRKYYQEKIREYDRQIEEIDMLIMNVTAPHSPVAGAVHGSGGQSHEARWAALIDRKDQIEAERSTWAIKKTRAERYYQQLMQSDENDFVKDYFMGMTMEALETKYHYSHAYRTMVRIIRNQIQKT